MKGGTVTVINDSTVTVQGNIELVADDWSETKRSSFSLAPGKSCSESLSEDGSYSVEMNGYNNNGSYYSDSTSGSFTGGENVTIRATDFGFPPKPKPPLLDPSLSE
jgi:hypothetical protein